MAAMTSSDALDATPRSASGALSFSFNVVYYSVVQWLATRGVCAERCLAPTTFCGHPALCCTQKALKPQLAALRSAVEHPRLLQLTCSLHVPLSSSSFRLVEGPPLPRLRSIAPPLGCADVRPSPSRCCPLSMCPALEFRCRPSSASVGSSSKREKKEKKRSAGLPPRPSTGAVEHQDSRVAVHVLVSCSPPLCCPSCLPPPLCLVALLTSLSALLEARPLSASWAVGGFSLRLRVELSGEDGGTEPLPPSFHHSRPTPDAGEWAVEEKRRAVGVVDNMGLHTLQLCLVQRGQWRKAGEVEVSSLLPPLSPSPLASSYGRFRRFILEEEGPPLERIRQEWDSSLGHYIQGRNNTAAANQLDTLTASLSLLHVRLSVAGWMEDLVSEGLLVTRDGVHHLSDRAVNQRLCMGGALSQEIRQRSMNGEERVGMVGVEDEEAQEEKLMEGRASECEEVLEGADVVSEVLSFIESLSAGLTALSNTREGEEEEDGEGEDQLRVTCSPVVPLDYEQQSVADMEATQSGAEDGSPSW